MRLNEHIITEDFKSSNIEKFSYNKNKKEFFVMYKGNSVYKYDNVEPTEIEELLKAESIGKHIRTTINNKPFEKIL